jgi:hypothetical protein
MKKRNFSFAEKSASEGDVSVGSSCERSFNTPIMFTRKPMETSDGRILLPTKADKASLHSSPNSNTDLQDFADS